MTKRYRIVANMIVATMFASVSLFGQPNQEQRQEALDNIMFPTMDPAELARRSPDVQRRYRAWLTKKRDEERQRQAWLAEEAAEQFFAGAASRSLKELRQFILNRPEITVSPQFPAVQKYISLREENEKGLLPEMPVSGPASDDRPRTDPVHSDRATQSQGDARAVISIVDGQSMIKPLKQYLEAVAGRASLPNTLKDAEELWYIIGLIEGIPVVMSYPLGDQIDTTLNFPEDGVSRDELVRIVVSYLSTHPESLKEVPQVVVMMAAEDAFGLRRISRQ